MHLSPTRHWCRAWTTLFILTTYLLWFHVYLTHISRWTYVKMSRRLVSDSRMDLNSTGSHGHFAPLVLCVDLLAHRLMDVWNAVWTREYFHFLSARGDSKWYCYYERRKFLFVLIFFIFFRGFSSDPSLEKAKIRLFDFLCFKAASHRP